MNEFQKEISEREIFSQKASRRKRIASLPIEEKIEILVKLQQMAFEVAKAQGRESKRPWNIKPSDEKKSEE